MPLSPDRGKFVIDLDKAPGLKRILDATPKQPGNPNVDASDTGSRTNAISGERVNPRRPLRRGLHPQE